MVVVLLLSRLCEDEALSRTQQAQYAVVGVFVIISLWVMGDVYYTAVGDVRSPPPLLLSFLLCCCCGARVVCLWWFRW